MENQSEERRSLKDDMDDSATPLTEDSLMDDSKVKFLNHVNGGQDSVVHIEPEVSSEVSFSGLGKEDLMKYAKDPFWVKVRVILFVLFWICWVGMLVAAIVIIVVAPRCPERKDMKWYEKDVIYQIFPKSFKDSTKDETDPAAGIGDLEGISSKIGYLQSIGVNAFWINAIYKSDNVVDQDDIVDHKKIDEVFGSQATFNALRKSTRKKGMKMLLDFIPNHTGKKHEWFQQSRMKDADYADFYVWADGPNNSTPPNNWKNRFGQSAWTYDAVRKQFYYHSSLPQYPELNLHNKQVQANLDSILRHWLDLGVDGFVIKDLEYLFEHNITSADETTEGQFTTNQEENKKLVTRWRNIINDYSDKPGRERVLVAALKNTADHNITRAYYDAGIHIVPSRSLLDVDASCGTSCLKEKLTASSDLGKWSGWMLDNDETPRFASHIEDSLHKAFQALNLLLPGTAFVYYGDEIAMTNGQITTPVDPAASQGMSRDAYRTPMLWSSNDNAGFCVKDATPWLPVNRDYMNTNVEFNTAHFVGYTIFESFRDLVALREKESFMFGSLKVDNPRNQVLTFTRKAEGFPGYLVAISMVDVPFATDFSHIASSMTVVYHSEDGQNSGSEVFNTKAAPVGFKAKGEVYVFEYN